MNQERIKFLKEAIQAHETALASLRLKKAQHGPLNVPEFILSDIREREKEIRSIKREIKKIKTTINIPEKETSKVPSNEQLSLVESVKEIVEKKARLKETL